MRVPVVGDKVRVTNHASWYFGREGVVVKLGDAGLGWYVQFDGGTTVYVPFGLELVQESAGS